MIKKSVLTITVLLLLSTLCFAQTIRVTVLSFEAEEGLSNSERAFAEESTYEALLKIGNLQIIDHHARDKIIQEQAFALSDLSAKEYAIRIGRLLSANSVLFGKIGRLRGGVFLSLRLVDAESGEILSSKVVNATSIAELQIHNSVYALFGLKTYSQPILQTRSLARLNIEANVKFPKLGGGTQTIYVEVTDESARPIPDAQVTMSVAYRTTTRQFNLPNTDSRGYSSASWRVGRPRGGYYVKIVVTAEKGDIQGTGETRFYAP